MCEIRSETDNYWGRGGNACIIDLSLNQWNLDLGFLYRLSAGSLFCIRSTPTPTPTHTHTETHKPPKRNYTHAKFASSCRRWLQTKKTVHCEQTVCTFDIDRTQQFSVFFRRYRICIGKEISGGW